MRGGAILHPGTMDRLMPMHLVLAGDGAVLGAGPTMRKLMPPDARRVEDVFVAAREQGPGCVLSRIRGADPARGMFLRLRHHPQLTLRGHVVALRRGGMLLNLGFGVSLSEAVAVFGLIEGDFAPTELALELMFLQEANRAIQQELARFNRQLRDARQQAEREAHTDPLTGLLNRRGLLAAMRGALDPGAGARAGGLALVHLDLDDFKRVNDRLGHAAGDRLLCNVAQVLRRAVRAGDAVARIGGDEFVLILAGPWSPAGLTALGERIIREIASVSPPGCPVSASLGIAPSAGQAPVDAARLLESADVALYRAKGAGKGRVSIAPLPERADVRPRPGPR